MPNKEKIWLIMKVWLNLHSWRRTFLRNFNIFSHERSRKKSIVLSTNSCILFNTSNRHPSFCRLMRLHLALLAIVFLSSCGADMGDSTSRHAQADALNEQAYRNRYVSLSETERYAEQALSESSDYSDGMHEALCHKAFALTMRADYAAAKRLYRQVTAESKNELLTLVADVGLMELCQRTSANKEYYDHRNNAQRHLNRLADVTGTMNPHQLRLWNYALSEYYYVSSVYDFYMNQRHEAAAEIRFITDHTDIIRNDTAQIAKYCYLRGSGGMIDEDESPQPSTLMDEGKPANNTSKEEKRDLMRCFSISVNKGLTFFIASTLQSCADNILNSTELLEQKDILVLAEYVKADYNDPDRLPLALARRSYQLLTDYGSPFSANASLITIADYYINHDEYALALDTLQTALDIINRHHQQHSDSTLQRTTNLSLVTYDTIPTPTSVEKQWIESHDESVNPLWMSSVREYLSICYSGMGDKAAADYNRNAYLDILDATRQDMEIENRYDKLSREERIINLLIVSLLAFLLLVVTLFMLFYRKQLRNKQRRKDKLMKLFDLCKRMTASVPSDADDDDDIQQAIDQAVSTELHTLFPTLDPDLNLADLSGKDKKETARICGSAHLTNYDRELLNVVSAFYDWLITNGKKVVSLNNRMQMSESRRYVHEMHVKENKCANIDKQACMSVVLGIMPFIDRITNELSRLSTSDETQEKREARLRYVEELVDKINADNELLVHWIKMSQGILSLNIETFSLKPLFELFAKNRASFEGKGIRLEVEPTDDIVRADRALTIFMVNTLLDNAMKYTPSGGTVRLTASPTDEAVEITVADSGRGLSADDIHLICGEKVYDASKIGISEGTDPDSTESNRELTHLKGFGFGLMNCKGIIEKYRKTNKLFSVCRFSVESELGKGSRFHFTLPKGVQRTMKLLALCLLPLAYSCTHMPPDNSPTPSAAMANTNRVVPDSVITILADSINDKLHYLVDNVYYCNVDGYYEDALIYADSAIATLNAFHRLMYPEDPRQMLFTYDNGTPTELDWHKEDHDMAYSIILDLRNEMAIAALALNRWDTYFSNNDTYTRMYRLVGQDKSLEQTCNNLQMANINKQTVLVVLFALLALSIVIFFILYYKFYLLHILNMEQYISFAKHMFSTDYNGNEEELDRGLVTDLYRGFSDVKLIDGMAIALNSDNGKGLLTAASEQCHNEQTLIQHAKDAYRQSANSTDTQSHIVSYPLTVSEEEGEQTIGGIALALHGGELSDDEEIIVRLMVQLTSIYLNNSLVQLNIRTNNIELMEDEEHRAGHEESVVHVQNMILDNCLSTIKHETMYYPNRIKQLVTAKKDGEEVDISSVHELASYYKDIYTILSTNALRQVTGKTFRRAACPSSHFADYAQHSFNKMASKHHVGLSLSIGDFAQEEVVCDKDLLEYLVDNLLQHAFELQQSGELLFESQSADRFVAFRFTDKRQTLSQQELNNLFYPENIHYDSRTDRLLSTQLIVCKQIVREHDEHSPFRGCRIYAEAAESGSGHTIVFTIPKKR